MKILHYKRITLDKGETKTVAFSLTSKNFFYINEEGNRVIEPEVINLYISGCQPGFSDNAINLIESCFEVQGEKQEYFM
ncbi:MAG: fibronectin type III-like domain-contianing protein [Promethearchaeota archaeon]